LRGARPSGIVSTLFTKLVRRGIIQTLTHVHESCSRNLQISCHCGRTVLEPPVPCGTEIKCSYPCIRPPPPCGHPRAPHLCHEDPAPCPPCVYLTEKRCACGKAMVGNIRCSQEKVSCGKPCGRLLGCGFHPCEQLCHSGACPPCTTICGKPRKLWYVLASSFVT
jgi:transcriptional repressor NF-X1